MRIKLADGLGALSFEKTLVEVEREVLRTMFHTAKAAGNELDTNPVSALDDIRRASLKVHRATQRGPANNLIANADMLNLFATNAPGGDWNTVSKNNPQKVGTLEGKWNIYLDPQFPEGEILLWYNGPSDFDTCIIYSPYTYGFVPFDHERTEFCGRTRHKITMVDTDRTYVVKLNVLERIVIAVSRDEHDKAEDDEGGQDSHADNK